jgi:hypothetical protein
MENLPISQTPTGIHIDGVPDAVMLVEIGGNKARQAADLMLHKKDLDFCLGCLDELAIVPPERTLIRQALWRAAIIHFVKCFTGNSARIMLSGQRIFKGGDALAGFTYLKNLRDKHFVHDESSYGQCIAGAAINNGQKSFKVEKVICLPFIMETLDHNSSTMLRDLANLTRSWVLNQFDDLCASITADLEKEPYEALANRKQATITVPTAEELKTRRSSGGRGRRRP